MATSGSGPSYSSDGNFNLSVSDQAETGESSFFPELSGLSLNPTVPHEEYEEPAPAPPITSEDVTTFDITKDFFAAAKTLGPGQLIRDVNFQLFDAVGAPEMMDPKMDTGCLVDDDSLEPDYDIDRDLLPAEVIGIIDQLLCHEMAWHMGYPLSQTILTNVYIENIMTPHPLTIEDAEFISQADKRTPMHIVLRAYCLGLLKTCFHVIERIRVETYYEEEDFVTNTFHRGLLAEIPREDIRNAIQDARVLVQSLRDSLTPELRQALDFRLELRHAFLRAIELTELRANPSSMKTPWVQMRAVLGQIKESHPLARAVPEAFSPKVQRRLASAMPPRPIVDLNFNLAYLLLTRLFEDGAEASDVLKYGDSQVLLHFVFWFAAKKPQAAVYIRTLLQSYIWRSHIMLNDLSIRHVLDDDMSLIVLPGSMLLDRKNDEAEHPSHPRFEIARQMESFRQKASGPYLDIFRCLCQNRCRMRRSLCHAIQDWEVVQVEAEEIDHLLQAEVKETPMVSQTTEPAYSLPLSSWAYLYKLRLMEWIVQLGFELLIYQKDEMGPMYWYLSYLAKKRLAHLERIKAFTDHHRDRYRAQAEAQGRALEAAKAAEFKRSLSYLRTAMVDAAATMELATSLSCLYTVLVRLALIVPPDRPYGTAELRYEMRMKPFAPVGLPELPTFDAEVGREHMSSIELLKEAERAAASARKAYEVMVKLEGSEALGAGLTLERCAAGIRNCTRSSIHAAIEAGTMRKAIENAEGGEEGGQLFVIANVPTPDEGYHVWWVVPRLKDIS